jgi:hypothetical protein
MLSIFCRRLNASPHGRIFLDVSDWHDASPETMLMPIDRMIYAAQTSARNSTPCWLKRDEDPDQPERANGHDCKRYGYSASRS